MKHPNSTHGMFGTPTYGSWVAMKQRCNNKNKIYYSNYGGRGIVVCDSWQHFEAFLDDMGERPEGCELDRINTDEGYNKANCRWVDRATNMRNRRCTRKANINGEVLTLMQISERYNLTYEALKSRWKKGDRDEELIRPLNSHKNKVTHL